MVSGKTALIDSSSAIILFKSGMFERACDFYRIIMAHSVFAELTRNAHPGTDEFILSRDAGSIKVMEHDDGGRTRDGSALNGLDLGERDTIRLFRAGAGDIIILDDGKGASYCKNNAIPYINALLVPRILHIAGAITQAECDESMSRITENGRYSRWVIDYARLCANDRLTPFI